MDKGKPRTTWEESRRKGQKKEGAKEKEKGKVLEWKKVGVILWVADSGGRGRRKGRR